MITWRNIDAIDTRGAQLGLSEAGRMFQGATDTLSNLANQQTQLNIRGDEQEQLRRLNQARAQLLGTTSSDALNQYDLNTLGQQFGLDAANTAALQDIFAKQLNEVQSDEYKAAEELRNVAKSDLDLRQGEQSIKLAGEAGSRAQQLFAGQLTGQKLQNLSSEASLNDTLRTQNTQSYLDSAMGTITDAMARGATEQEIAKLVEGLTASAPNAEAATKLTPAIQGIYEARDQMTPTQKRHHAYLVNSIETEAANELAKAEGSLASVTSKYPITPTYDAMQNMKSGADWVGYINEKAPDALLSGIKGTGDSSGTGAKSIIANARKALEGDDGLKKLLVDQGIIASTSPIKVPDEVIMYTLQQQIIDPDDQEIDLSNFKDDLSNNFKEYLTGRYNAGEVAKAQSAYNSALNSIAKNKNNRLAKSFDEAKNNKLIK